MPADGAGPEPAAAEPPADGVPPADALPRATSGSRCRSRSRSPPLVTGRFGEGWLADTRRATLVAWGFLTVGIVLGAWWSYEVLGWGGYWAWDPVENASLLPWLTGDRVHPLGDRAGAPRDAAGLEPVARDRDVLPHDPRHVPHPVGRPQLGALVHESAIGPMLLGVPRVRRRRGHRAHRLARRPAARARAHRLAGVARGGVPRQQPAVRRRSRSSCCSAPCTRCSPRRSRTGGCRWASRTSTG